MKKHIVELWRAVATAMILLHHTYLINPVGLSDHFGTGWVFVELFLIFTGYFTMEHFARREKEIVDLDESARASISYTIKKFSRIIPYTAVPVVCYYTMTFVGGLDGVEEIEWMILEALLLRANIVDVTLTNGPLWYLSAMMAIFPLFCCICQIKSKNLIYILAWTIAPIWYGYTQGAGYTHAPVGLIRTFVGLMLGAIVYGMAKGLAGKTISKRGKLWLTVAEILSLSITVIFAWFSFETFYLYLLLFVAGTAIMFSGVSYTANFQFKALSGISEFLLSIYAWHWLVGWLVRLIDERIFTLSWRLRETLYIVGTVVVAAVSSKVIKSVIAFITKSVNIKTVK